MYHHYLLLLLAHNFILLSVLSIGTSDDNKIQCSYQPHQGTEVPKGKDEKSTSIRVLSGGSDCEPKNQTVVPPTSIVNTGSAREIELIAKQKSGETRELENTGLFNETIEVETDSNATYNKDHVLNHHNKHLNMYLTKRENKTSLGGESDDGVQRFPKNNLNKKNKKIRGRGRGNRHDRIQNSKQIPSSNRYSVSEDSTEMQTLNKNGDLIIRSTKSNNRIDKTKRIQQSKKNKGKKKDSNLDIFLPYFYRMKRRGVVLWKEKSPLPSAYFGIAIENKRKGRRNLKKKRAESGGGISVFATGLSMPVGYTQTMEGFLLEDESGRALVRVLDPEMAGPFAEFKIRVENRYGTPCKQMCLVGPAGKQRYRRCTRRVVRLSTHAKFSDPISFYKTPEQAAHPVRIGRDGSRRHRKPDYLFFKCE